MLDRFLACAVGSLLFVGSSARAQATWIVDVNNGPGTHFTSLQTAIFLAAPGDRLLVRAGNYLPAVMDRPLTIVGEGVDRVFVTGSGGFSPGFLIHSIPAGSHVAIEGITFAATALANISLAVWNCAGRVILDRVRSTQQTSFTSLSDVRCTRCEFQKGLSVSGSTCALDRCVIQADPLAQTAVSPGLRADASFLHLDRCHVHGRNRTTVGLRTYAESAAIVTTASTLVLSGDGTGLIAAGLGGSTPAVEGSGTVEIDPHVVLQPTGAAPATIGVTVTTRARPSLAVDAGQPGGTVDIDLFGTPANGYAAAVGIAVAPWDVPALGGRLWMDTLLLWGLGQFDATGRMLGQFPLPNLPAIVGMTFTWQAAEFGATAITLSNCVSYVHPM